MLPKQVRIIDVITINIDETFDYDTYIKLFKNVKKLG
jgi:hypothetical protein